MNLRVHELPSHTETERSIRERTLECIDSASARNPHRPYVTLSYAQSLDGCISATAGVGTTISNDCARVVTHELRAAHDGILIGINTVLVDDPRLTVRFADGADPQPIVVDSHLRLPLHSRLVESCSHKPIVATLSSASEKRCAELESLGVTVLRVPANDEGMVDLRSLFRELVELDFRSVMVEGGARVISRVLSQRLADQLVLTISPMILGGVRAVERFNEEWNEAPSLRSASWHWADGNLLLQGELETSAGEESN